MLRRSLFVAVAVAACASSSGRTTDLSDVNPAPSAPPSASADGGDASASVALLPDRGAAGVDSGAGADADVLDLAPYRIVGRFDARDPAGPRLGWAGTEVRARFRGAAVAIELADTGRDQFDVAIDGDPPTRLVVTGAGASYSLASGLADGDHELVLTKRTETSVGVAQLLAIDATLSGTPSTETTSTRRIEMIGDSITNGFGVLGADQTCPFSPDTEDEAMAWGALAAKQLSAEHTAIAWSGIGLYRNYDGTLTGTMPDLYPLALADDPSSMWRPSAFEPDIVVINLGTNDFSEAQGGDPGPDFPTTLVSFLATIRTMHAGANIILATSPMLSGDDHSEQMAYLQGATAARSAAGDRAISVIDLPVAPDSDGYGCNWHPSAITQQKMADTLVAQIEAVTGW